MRTLTTQGKKLTTGLGWWRRHQADDGSDSYPNRCRY